MRRAARHRIEQAVGHARGEPRCILARERRSDLELEAEFFAEAAARFLDPGDRSVRIGADETRAHVDRRDRNNPAVAAHRDLRGAAADIDIHHRAALADRAGDRTRAERRHHRFKIVAGTDGDELAGLPCEQFADAPRIAAPHRNAREDQRAGVDLVGIDHRVLVLLLEERAERFRVDLILGRIGREQNIGLIKGLAFGHDITAVEPLQHDAREHEMRGRRPDIDANAQDADFIFFRERAAGRRKEYATAVFINFNRHLCSGPMPFFACRSLLNASSPGFDRAIQ